MARRPDPRYPARQRERGLAWLHDHYEALTRRCPACRAAVDAPCTNPITGAPIAAPAHWQRLRLARVAPSTVPLPRSPEPTPDTAQPVPAAPGGTS